MARSPTRADRKRRPSQADYEALADFRYELRRFLEFSEAAASAVGLTPRQHQALLAMKGSGRPLAVRDLAERLRIRHQTAVELADRLQDARLAARRSDPDDQRRVLLDLTPHAEDLLADLSAAHLDELARIKPVLRRILKLEED